MHVDVLASSTQTLPQTKTHCRSSQHIGHARQDRILDERDLATENQEDVITLVPFSVKKALICSTAVKLSDV